MQNILGISLKTKFLGMAIFYNGELTDYRMRTFYGSWTKRKRDDMKDVIQRLITRYGINIISLKTPKPTHCSQSISEIVEDIRNITKELCMDLIECTIDALTALFEAKTKSNRKKLIHAIIYKYPHHPKLAQLHEKERRNRNPYHVKIFEAIACGELALRTKQ